MSGLFAVAWPFRALVVAWRRPVNTLRALTWAAIVALGFAMIAALLSYAVQMRNGTAAAMASLGPALISLHSLLAAALCALLACAIQLWQERCRP